MDEISTSIGINPNKTSLSDQFQKNTNHFVALSANGIIICGGELNGRNNGTNATVLEKY